MRDAFAAASAALGDDRKIVQILQEVCRITQMGFAAVARVTDDRWVCCQVEDKIEFGLKPGDELAIKTTICNEIRACGAAVVIDHVAANPEWRTHHTPMLYGFESYASFPLFLANGSFFGTLCAIDPEARSVSAPDVVTTLESFAAEIAALLSAKMEDLPNSPVAKPA